MTSFNVIVPARACSKFFHRLPSPAVHTPRANQRPPIRPFRSAPASTHALQPLHKPHGPHSTLESPCGVRRALSTPGHIARVRSPQSAGGNSGNRMKGCAGQRASHELGCLDSHTEFYSGSRMDADGARIAACGCDRFHPAEMGWAMLAWNVDERWCSGVVLRGVAC
ncbi:hypothetical protein BD779DRAFT_1473194 [Infundibulicybe gibba]|nr:hypothetical protein BD779DRAFT_1473194 [Infundibulicybe gibba]